jgi:hypothetical protein
MTPRKTLIVHPILIALYPVAAFLGANIGHVAFVSGLRAAAVCLLLAGVVWGALRLLLRDAARAAFLTTIGLVLFFSYGHVYTLVRGLDGGAQLGRDRYLLPTFGLVLLGSVAWALRRGRDLQLTTTVLNVFAVAAFLLPLGQILTYPIRSPRVAAPDSAPGAAGDELPRLTLPAGTAAPDIYYIILDTYTRDDVLAESLDYDNSDFTRRLEEMGFYVAQCSSSNYSRTMMSVASSLNLGYLEDFAPQMLAARTDPYRLDSFIRHSLLRRTLEAAGYRTIALASGFAPTEWADADVYLSPRQSTHLDLFGGLNETESYLLKGSAGVLLYRIFPRLPFESRLKLDYAYVEHRQRIEFALDELPKLASLEGPKFIFVHLLAPHEPFVFTADGGYVERRTPFTLNNDEETWDWNAYASGYAGQLAYLNSRLLDVVQTILADSDTPPVIVLQGDHGIRRMDDDWEQTAILNAYFVPDVASGTLYPTISPVNSFRLLFDTAFGAELEMLSDRTYLSVSRDDYDFRAAEHAPGECTAPK